MNQIIQWSQGNPGAMMFLLELSEDKNLMFALVITFKLERCKTIRGTNLYVLHSDLCNKDLSLVAKLCANCPNDILEDACSRQDYSGRQLVESYLK